MKSFRLLALIMLLGSASSRVLARTVDVYIHGGPATNSISYGVNEEPTVSYSELTETLSRVAKVSKELRVRIITDKTVAIESIVKVVDLLRKVELHDFALIVCSKRDNGDPVYTVLFGQGEDVPPPETRIGTDRGVKDTGGKP